jgi:hypothetical protein
MDMSVINMFDRKKIVADKEEYVFSEKEEEGFAEVMKRNAENKARVAKERAGANKSVLRSHRLDKKKK